MATSPVVNRSPWMNGPLSPAEPGDAVAGAVEIGGLQAAPPSTALGLARTAKARSKQMRNMAKLPAAATWRVSWQPKISTSAKAVRPARALAPTPIATDGE